MINMMYLVLIALLALNVSKEVLDAFVLINQGLVRTTANFSNKNDRFMQILDRLPRQTKPLLDPGRGRPFK